MQVNIYYLISLSNGISTVVVIQCLCKRRIGALTLPHSWRDKHIHAFPKGISSILCARERLDLEHYHVAV